MKSQKNKSKSHRSQESSVQANSSQAEQTSQQQPVSFLDHLEFFELMRLFVVWFVAQSIVLFILAFIFPESIVLGTQTISILFAVFYSMFVLTLFAVGAIPLIELLQDVKHRELGTTEWMLFYIAVNSAGLWLISRFAYQLGLGLSSWIVAASIGVVFSFLQGFFAMRMGK